MQAKHPSSYLELAILYAQKNKPGQALATLDTLFANSRPAAVRSAPIYDEARRVYRHANERVAEQSFDEAMALVEERRETLSVQTTYPIEFVEVERLPAPALTEIACQSRRKGYRIKHRRFKRKILPHVLAHELEHIAMEDQARRLGKNRILTTTRQTRRVFEKAVGNHRSRLRSLQFDAVEIPEVMDNFFHGLVDNLYNTALDMLVESRLYQNAAPLRASQLISLDARLVANVEMTIGIGVDEIMPDCVYQAGVALDCAYALPGLFSST